MNNNFLNYDELLKKKFKSLGSNVKISKNVTIIGENNITIGSNVRIDDFSIISSLEGKLDIGSNVHIGGQSYLGCGGEINIGNNINISQGVRIYSKLDNYLEFIDNDNDNVLLKKVSIQDNVIIGSGVVIVGETYIGEGTTIGALSFVKGNLDSWSVYAGNPIKFIKSRKIKK